MVGESWMPEHKADALERVAAGEDLAAIAHRHRRTVKGIKYLARKNGVAIPGQRTRQKLWTPEILDQARELYQGGYSATEIARTLPIDVSRNAILGQAHRRGWTRGQARQKPAVPPKPKPKKSALRKTKLKPIPKRKGFEARSTPAKANWTPDADRRSAAHKQKVRAINAPSPETRIDIMALKPDHCRFIVEGTGASALYCGANRDTSAKGTGRQSYCPAHGQLISYGPRRAQPRPTQSRHRNPGFLGGGV